MIVELARRIFLPKRSQRIFCRHTGAKSAETGLRVFREFISFASRAQNSSHSAKNSASSAVKFSLLHTTFRPYILMNSRMYYVRVGPPSYNKLQHFYDLIIKLLTFDVSNVKH